MATEQQTRWLCLDCAREWLYAHHWSAADGCPACQSHAIEPRTYQPAFPGADVPRTVVATAPLRLIAPPAQPNLTLALLPEWEPINV